MAGIEVPGHTYGEPVAERLNRARAELLHVVVIVDVGGDGVVDIDGQHLPIGLASVVGRKAAQELDLLDLADVADTARCPVPLVSVPRLPP